MDEGAGVVVVDRAAPGVRVRPVADPLGCRPAGPAEVRPDGVRLPLISLLGGGRQPLSPLVTTALAYGRISSPTGHGPTGLPD